MVVLNDRIVASPEVLSGKPVICGTRISVELILTRLAEGASLDDLLLAWPNMERADILAALAYSAEVISHEELIAV